MGHVELLEPGAVALPYSREELRIIAGEALHRLRAGIEHRQENPVDDHRDIIEIERIPVPDSGRV